jgi:hypothetical protein
MVAFPQAEPITCRIRRTDAPGGHAQQFADVSLSRGGIDFLIRIGPEIRRIVLGIGKCAKLDWIETNGRNPADLYSGSPPSPPAATLPFARIRRSRGDCVPGEHHSGKTRGKGLPRIPIFSLT